MVILCGVCVWHALIGAVILPLTQPSTASSSSLTTDAMTTSFVLLNVSTAATTASTIGPTGNTSSVYSLTSVVGITSDAGGSTTCTSQSTTSTSVTDAAQTADNIALGTLGSLYVAFHLVFVVLIISHSSELPDGWSSSYNTCHLQLVCASSWVVFVVLIACSVRYL